MSTGLNYRKSNIDLKKSNFVISAEPEIKQRIFSKSKMTAGCNIGFSPITYHIIVIAYANHTEDNNKNSRMYLH